MHIIFRLLLCFIALFSLTLCQAANQSSQDLYPFSSVAESQRFQSLLKEIRCPICQGESIADSNAPLAKDLRMKIYAMLNNHHTPEEIKTYLRNRYGEVILFKPRFNSFTGLLWLWPILLISFAMVILRNFFKKNTS